MAGTAHVYLIFWEPSGHGVTAGYNQLIERYFQDVNDTGLYKNNEQYTNASGQYPADEELAGTFLDTHPYPANPMTDARVRAEVTHAMTVNGWEASIDNIFFVYTGMGEHNAHADVGGNCAYHSSFGTDTIYAPVIYPTVRPKGLTCLIPPPSPNHNLAADSAISISSHEQMEAATDPIITLAGHGTGWFHVNTAHEIADECHGEFGPRTPLGNNVVFNGHPYVVQKEWDNEEHGCVLAGP